MPKAKELAEQLLIKRTPKGAIIRNRMYLYEAMKTKFGFDDETEMTEEEFRQYLQEIEGHRGGDQ